MTKSKNLAKEYMEKKKLCSEEEKNTLINEYEKINNMGIPFMVYSFAFNALLKIIIYAIVTII